MKKKVKTLEAFYRRKFDWIPKNLKNEIGQLNLSEIACALGFGEVTHLTFFSSNTPR